VTASLRAADHREIEKLSVTVVVGTSLARQRVSRARQRLVYLELLVSAIAAVVAVVTGLWVLYTGKPFGTLAQYSEAFVWGFGIDNTVRGFAAVLKKVGA
jgi:hypothetical protein